MDAPSAGRLIDPRIIWEQDIGTTAVLCSCGAQMAFETGGEVSARRKAHEWAWWRCLENPVHITRAIPMPVRMARG